MIDLLSSLLAAVGGLVVFAAAYYVHQKVRLTRTACVAAAVGGFITYSGVIGSWANRYASQVAVVTAVGVFIWICVIVADVKGKKKGADRPALFAFFFLPIFLVSGLVAASTLVSTQLRPAVEKTTTNIQQRVG
jgi:hypothetical protein